MRNYVGRLRGNWNHCQHVKQLLLKRRSNIYLAFQHFLHIIFTLWIRPAKYDARRANIVYRVGRAFLWKKNAAVNREIWEITKSVFVRFCLRFASIATVCRDATTASAKVFHFPLKNSKTRGFVARMFSLSIHRIADWSRLISVARRDWSQNTDDREGNHRSIAQIADNSDKSELFARDPWKPRAVTAVKRNAWRHFKSPFNFLTRQTITNNSWTWEKKKIHWEERDRSSLLASSIASRPIKEPWLHQRSGNWSVLPTIQPLVITAAINRYSPRCSAVFSLMQTRQRKRRCKDVFVREWSAEWSAAVPIGEPLCEYSK